MPLQPPYPPDYPSALTTRELQAIMRDASSLPLTALLNSGQVTVDYEGRRVWRDCFWKGSFARDTAMGWEERLVTPIRTSGAQYAGGRFWKRFDDLHDGGLRGLIVNYGLAWLPGRPAVTQIRYPDDRRRYIKAGDTALLLTYLNQPYRIVYDLMKVVDDRHCIGVMHLGRFPRGRVFATFVMARNNYPFHKMTVPDHEAIFAGAHARAPQPADVTGKWIGHVVFLNRPDNALHNQFNPPIVRLECEAGTGRVITRLRVGFVNRTVDAAFGPECLTLDPLSSRPHEIRHVAEDVLLGRRMSASGRQLRYVLTRSTRQEVAETPRAGRSEGDHRRPGG